MWFFVVVVVACAVLLPVALRRSGGVWTRYLTGTGAPIVWVLLGASALVSLVVELLEGGGDDGLAQSLFVGGLVGTAFVQVLLLRRAPLRGRDHEGDA